LALLAKMGVSRVLGVLTEQGGELLALVWARAAVRNVCERRPLARESAVRLGIFGGEYATPYSLAWPGW